MSPLAPAWGTAFLDAGSGDDATAYHYGVAAVRESDQPQDPAPPDPTAPDAPENVTLLYCYGDHAEGYARNDAVLAWDPVPEATAYHVYRDGSLLDTVDTSADCLVVAEPLGHTYTVAAVNEVGSSSSTEAQLVSHDPWYDSCNVVDSGSDEADLSLSADYCGDSILLDPEIKDVWIHCTFTSDSDGIVMVGVTDAPVDPTCTDEPSWRYVDQEEADEFLTCDFHVTDAWMESDKPTYLTVFIEPLEGQQNWSCTTAEFAVNGIKPFWVDVGVEAPEGGMSRDESGNWMDSGGDGSGGTNSNSYSASLMSRGIEGGRMDFAGVESSGANSGSGCAYVPTGVVQAANLVISGVWAASGRITITYNSAALQVKTSAGVSLSPGSYAVAGSGCVTVNGLSVNLNCLKVYGQASGGVFAPRSVHVCLSLTSSEVINSSEVLLATQPDIMISPGIENSGLAGMESIQYKILNNIQNLDYGYANVQVVSPLVDQWATIESLAKQKAQFAALDVPYHPIILIGYSDGASNIRNYVMKLDQEYRGAKIDYVGLIDPTRTATGIGSDPPGLAGLLGRLPDWFSLSWELPDNIEAGDNFYQQGTFLQYMNTIGNLNIAALRPIRLPLFWGHEICAPWGYGNSCTKINHDITYMRGPWSTADWVGPGHTDMPGIEIVQDTIARRAAEAYAHAQGIL